MKITRKEFALKCGITQGNLTNCITRNHVILDDNMVDLDNEQNAYFLEKRQQKKPNKGVKVKPGKKSEKGSMLTVEKAKIQNASLLIDQQRKKADSDYKQAQARMLALKEGKILGEYFQKDLVRQMFTQHFRSLIITVKDGIDRFIIDYAKKYKLKQNDVAQLRKDMVNMLNKSVERAALMTDKELETLSHKDKAAA